MIKLRKKKIFKEDIYQSDDEYTGDISKNLNQTGDENQEMKKQIRLLQSEVKTLKKLSILSVFGGKVNMKKFYKDCW